MATISGSAGADTILPTGVSAAVTIIGGLSLLANADSIAGGAGTDSILAGAGADTVLGEADSDTIAGQGGNDLLVGGQGSDQLLGGAGADTLDGGTEADRLFGGDGADSILGGLGSDQLFGGRGNDSLFSGIGLDTLDGGEGVDLLSDVTLDTTPGASNQLMLGGAGNDSLQSADGSDTLDGGEGFDAAFVGGASATNGGTTNAGSMVIDLAAGAVFNRGGPNGGIIILRDIEAVNAGAGNDTLLGSDGDDIAQLGGGDDSADGGAGNDCLTGSRGNDTLQGGEGADTLEGNDENDLLQGGGGDDVLTVSLGTSIAGADTLDGGTGFDLLRVIGAPVFNLAAGSYADTASSVTFTGFEGVIGGFGSDTIGGDTQSNLLDGGSGNDSLSAGIGADTLLGGTGTGADTLAGGAGNDSLDGGDFADLLFGDADSDTLFGGADSLADTLDGGTGANLLDGGGGNDLLIGNADGAADTILGGDGALDTLSYANAGASVFATVLAAGDADTASTRGDLIRGVESVIGSVLDDFIEIRGSFAPRVDANGGRDLVSIVLPRADANVTLGGALSGGAGFDGLRLVTDPASTGILTVNLSSGAIQSFDVVFGSAGRDRIIGGTDATELRGEGGDDTIVSGAGSETLDGGADRDLLDFLSFAGGVVVTMQTVDRGVATGHGEDAFVGFELIRDSLGADRFTGVAEGPAGSLIFSANQGADTIDAQGSLATQLRINPAVNGAVMVDLLAGTATSGGGTPVVDRLIGVRNIDLSATPGAHSVRGTEAAEILRGGNAADSILGGGGADTLFGSFEVVDAGADTLVAGSTAERAGSALLIGFSGDRLEGRAAGAAGDRAYLRAFESSVFVGFGRLENVADLSTSSGDIVINLATQTTEAFGVLRASFDGIRAVRAGFGADTLIGGAAAEEFDIAGGADSLDGGGGRDRVAYAGATAGVRVDLSAGRATEAGGAVDRFAAIEDAAGSAFADTLVGDAGDNLLAPLGGADSVVGGLGNDTVSYAEFYLGLDALPAGVTVDLFRGTATDPWGATDILRGIEAVFGTDLGDDLTGAILPGRATSLLRGNAGNDIIRALVADTGATADYGADPAAVLVNLGATAVTFGLATIEAMTALDGHGDTDLLINIQAAWGSAFADTMIGSLRAETLVGADGADSLRGGDGSDLLEGGAGGDRLDGGLGARDAAGYAFAASGVGVSLLAPATNTGDAAGDVYAGIEDLVGSAFADTLAGNGDANQIRGGAGADTIDPGAGNDSVQGGDGNDLILGGAGGDSMSGGEGFDTVTYERATLAVVVVLTNSVGNTNDALGDRYGGIEGLRGTSLADRLTANALDNLVAGLDGADSLAGGDGADTLVGGAGADSLVGGTGADRFFWNAAPVAIEADRVGDFARVQDDKLVFLGSVFGNLGAGVLQSANFVAAANGTSISGPGVPQFVYNVGTGGLFFDADGNGGASVLVATIAGAPTMVASDILIV